MPIETGQELWVDHRTARGGVGVMLMTGYWLRQSMWGVLRSAAAIIALSPLLVSAVRSESVAPSVHWGAIGYPDQERALLAGVTLNRFTEFTHDGKRFGAVDETAGFNFATVTWTERVSGFPGWSTNLTVGAGPTYPEPTRSLQNNFVHHLLGNDSVPVGRRREEADFMVNGSVTRWVELFGQRDTGFASVGFASGSLYHEAIGRIGLRRLSLAALLRPVIGDSRALDAFSRHVRFSGMGQYGRLFGGAAYGGSVLADQSFLGQIGVSIGSYGDGGSAPEWELEFAATIDSGLFVMPAGRSIERRFGTIALRFPYGVLETWNDWLGGTDSGPTFGVQLMFDVRRIYGWVTQS